MSLETDLQAIDGVGPATAEKIVGVVEDHQEDAASEGGTADDTVERALTLLRNGRADLARAKLEQVIDA